MESEGCTHSSWCSITQDALKVECIIIQNAKCFWYHKMGMFTTYLQEGGEGKETQLWVVILKDQCLPHFRKYIV